ncbi:hypothetical protein B0H14DRAFT_3451531 [Mycena olivaceomarginata]|nr:hypothetical protein B0H14DRAFT_3451531 [Mycena olivaceomarginata]
MRVDWENDDESDIESEADLDDFDDEEFGIDLLEMAEKEDPKDLDWLPPKLQALQMRKNERPQHYNTTADGMNKAQSTAYRYAAQLQDQDLLDSYGFSSSRRVTSTLPITSKKLPPAWKKAMLQTEGPQGMPTPVITDLEGSSDDDIQIISAPTSPQVPAVRRASQSPEMSEEDLPPISEPVSSAAVSDEEEMVQMSEPVSSAAPSEPGDDLPDKELSCSS